MRLYDPFYPAAEIAEIERLADELDEAKRTLRAARFVADHWRRALLGHPGAMAHPLCMVLTALDGSTDPVECGIDQAEHDAFRAALKANQ